VELVVLVLLLTQMELLSQLNLLMLLQQDLNI